MRPFPRLNRRSFLCRTLALAGAWVAAGWTVAREGRAKTIDYFSGTEFVGKTRAGSFKKFYINYWKPFRRIDPEAWRLEIGGLCDSPRTLKGDDLKSFTAIARNSRLKCVECWSARADWKGFRFAALEELCPPKSDAVGVLFHCADNYREYLSLGTLRHPHTLLATHMDGAPLSDEHGFPLRIIAPMKYGYKNPKAIVKIEYVDRLTYGTWSKIGPYSPDGTILPGTDHPLEFDKRPRRIAGGEITAY